MAHVNLPKLNQTGVNEFQDVQDNDQAIIDQLNGNVDDDNLADGAVTESKIADGSVTDDKLGAGAVTAAKIPDASVTLDKVESATQGRLIVVDAFGRPKWVAISGGGTVSNTGSFALANGIVSAANIGSLPACILEKTAQSIPNDTVTALTWETEVLDTDTMHSVVSNTERITATTAGLYLFTATVVFGANANGARYIGLYGSPGTVRYFGVAETQIPIATEAALSTSGIVKLTAGQYVEVRVRHTRGSALNVANSGPGGLATDIYTRFAASFLGAG